MNDKHRILLTVLNELDHFESSFHVSEYQYPKFLPEAAIGIREVHDSEIQLQGEPFISYVKVRQSDNRTDWEEKIYLICRNYSPTSLEPITPNSQYANRNAKIGQIASADVGNEISIKLPGTTKTRVYILIEKNIFTPYRREDWDAISNYIFYKLRDEFEPSARKIFPKVKTKPQERQIEIAKPSDKRGEELLKELEIAELEHVRAKTATERYLESRTREIVQSIALKDQPILDRSQDEICRLPIASQIILTGSPGTGKTTTLIKRLSFKSDPRHLFESDEIEVDLDRLDRWIMFTPNDLLKDYLKEAMNKEGLSATNNQVVTWERYRSKLGREVLKFLKHGEKGFFTRTSTKVLSDSSSSGQVRLASEFVAKFGEDIAGDFDNAIAVLFENRPPANVISKENSSLSQELVRFTGDCKRVFESNSNSIFVLPELKVISLIESFSSIRERWAGLKHEVGGLIKQVIDDAIAANPDIIEFVAMSIEDERGKAEAAAEESGASDDLVDDIEEDEDLVIETQDLNLEARRLLQQIVLRYAEGLASAKPLRNKRFLGILSLVGESFSDTSLLTFIGHMNLALKPTIFGRLDYSRILVHIAPAYNRFRQGILRVPGAEKTFLQGAAETIKNRRISPEEEDILIFVILRFISKIFEVRKEFLNEGSKVDLLENAKTILHTQVAVDEAADFSAIQLASIFHLAHPEFCSVSFAGDLMQRMTSTGIQNWNECDFISASLKREELLISYRQTPILLKMAGKLYENTIGESAPFRSKNIDTVYDPRPLKLQTESDNELGEWIGQRIHEIYLLNGEKLPSIALFVPNENDISRLHAIVHEKLNEFSIDVEKCNDGKILGTGDSVRIFSVEYIKGLEFEAVFFVGIDEIYEKEPDILDKYLYVGLTRATTFLGVTYKQSFPETLKFLESDFQFGDWSKFAEEPRVDSEV